MNKAPPIHKTYFVTFPRSGHHWIERILSRYFQESWHYCEPYAHPELKMECCFTTNVEKTHDFDLNFEPVAGSRIIVQCRRNINEAMRSWFSLGDSPATTVEEFARNKQEYWLGFLARWCCGDYPIIWYQEFRSNPIGMADRAIRILTDEPVDRPRLIEAVSKEICWPRYGIGCLENVPSI